AFLSALESQTIDGSRASLIHDPGQHRSRLRSILRSPCPEVMKHVQRELFGGFATVGQTHHEREDQPMRAPVELAKCRLLTGGHALYELNPVSLRYTTLGVVGIKDVTQGP